MEDHGAMIHFFPQQDSGARDPPVSNEKDAKDSLTVEIFGEDGRSGLWKLREQQHPEDVD